MTSKSRLTSSGHLAERRVHDGYLVGITLSEKAAQLHIIDAAGSRFQLALHGLSQLRAEDFREGNIILDLTILPCGDDDRRSIRWLLDLRDCEEDERYIDAMLTEVHRDKLLLVKLGASYGCTLMALCQSIEIQEPPQPL